MKNATAIRTALRGAAALLALLFVQVTLLGAQGLPLDDKAKYEKSLEGKVDEVLVKLLGPNQAKVVVQADMDFTRTEEMNILKAGGDKAAPANKDEMFKWQSPTTEGQPFNEYLLPGFPTMSAEGENQSYSKKLSFPTSFVRKLVVTVIINKTMSDADAQNVRSVVSEVLGLDVKRGDDIAIIKTPFAPLWRTIWNTPESMALIFKYSLLTIMGIISMMVAVGFLKLATAMNTMAKAQQSHQITMDLGRNAAMGGGAAGAGLPGGAPGPGQSGKLEVDIVERKDGGGRHSMAEPDQEQLFNVRLEQIDFLVNLMSGEDPANISLVAGHLPEDVKTEFLRMLPAETSSEVVANMARMRFVDPEVISTIRDEIEKQLAGAFGGINVVIDTLDRVSLKVKREMIAKLESHHPDIAAKVRRRILLPEDLMKLSEKDLGVLATAVKIEDWAMALWDFSPEFRDKLKMQLTEKTWAMLEQTMKYGAPSQEKTEKAVDAVVTSALKLIGDGRIADPLKAAAAAAAEEKSALVPAGAAPAAPAPEAPAPAAPAGAQTASAAPAAPAPMPPAAPAAPVVPPQAPPQPPPPGGKV